MSDIIHLLPDSIANQIAAGEVIQRPASVVKELVENAVDAGAGHIQVNIKDAGRTLVQVIDDGKGMSETDARMAFERHATSKISTADDLFSLHTMGFRGEALASIVAVSQVELRTRLKGAELGTHLVFSGSELESVEPDACTEGSIFSVKNLFFNVPARRKFLKSNETEFRNIINEFERIALVNSQVALSLYHNDTEIFNLPESGLRQRIVNVYGKTLNQKLLSVDAQSSLVTISGFVGRPDSAKKRGALQYFFVNGRFMKHPYFHKAVMTAFDRLIPIGEQVPYFIYFDIAPGDIDVNIHPTKTEIKFENEQTIWQMLVAAVKDSLGRFNDVPSIDFDTEGKPDIPVFDPLNTGISAPKTEFNPDYNPFKEPSAAYPRASRGTTMDNWENLYEGLGASRQTDDLTSQIPSDNIFDGQAEPTVHGGIADEKSPVHYQYKGKYIMTAVKSGLMIIDQNRAHMRILYEKYLSRIENRTGNSQKMLFPEIVQFSPSECIALEKIIDETEALGFDIAPLGGGSYSVNGVPSGLEGVDYVRLLRNIVAEAVEGGVSAGDALNRSLAVQMARSAAIPYGQVLGNAEMEDLVNELFACSNVNHTPDGKPVISILKQQDIDHLFG